MADIKGKDNYEKMPQIDGVDIVPLGGSTGEVLTKDTNTAYDYSWQAPTGGGDVSSALSITDNTLVIGDGGAKGVQAGAMTLTDTGTLRGVDGAVGAPTYSFLSDTDSGMFIDQYDGLGFAYAGVETIVIYTSGVTLGKPIYNIDGTATVPSISFSTDANLGLYRVGADQLGFTTGGTQRMVIGPSSINLSLPIYGSDGFDIFPTYTFSGDPDTGMYRSGVNAIGFATASTLRLEIEANGTLNVSNTNAYENLVTHDDDIPNKKYVDTAVAAGGGGTGTSTQKEFYADQVEYCNGTDWYKQIGAGASVDSNNSALTVRCFDDIDIEAVGFMLAVPSGATTITIENIIRAETGPTTTKAICHSISFRHISHAATPSTWTAYDLPNVSIPTNETWQVQVISALALGTVGLTAGKTYQFQYYRRSTDGSDTLVGDMAWLKIGMEF